MEPKDRREDLYDFDRELRVLERALLMSKLVVVKGIKRTGKTSLMKTALNVTGLPYILGY